MLNFNYQYNTIAKTQSQKLSFGGGLTAKMVQEIQQADVLEISNRLAQKGIPTDFKGNKVVAWCCDKTVSLFQQFNKKFGTRLALPKGIYVEDFKNLNDNPNAFGTCNLLPSQLRKNSPKRISEKTIFFNSLINWNEVDALSDFNFEKRMFSSDFFLYPFLHEFSHVLHLDKLIKNFDGKILKSKFESVKNQNQIIEFRNKYKDTISSICDYALKNPLDAIACDLPTKIINSIDKNNLTPLKNPFVKTPYEIIPFWKKTQKHPNQDEHLEQVLRNFWNGEFD